VLNRSSGLMVVTVLKGCSCVSWLLEAAMLLHRWVGAVHSIKGRLPGLTG
jgi:hypothetical protein